MLIKTITVGPFETNCYIVTDEKTRGCVVIDPGAEAAVLLNYLEENRLNCHFVLLTHGHFDHVGAVAELVEETGAPLWMHEKDNGTAIGGGDAVYSAPAGAHFFRDGDVITCDALAFAVLETPGHTPGSVCFLCTAADGDRALFSGDTLFRDSCGRTDFRLGSTEDMFRSLRRLAGLEGDCEVYPGHGFSTTLDRERAVNYFMAAALRQ
jgi:glyoxylase-like metal-dependent hydrolase (beta-lactamase superfamily II)